MTMESKTSQKAPRADADPTAYTPPSHSPDGAKELARLFGEVLAQMRNDPLFRPPPLSQAALDAIVAYEVMSGALNPSKAPPPIIGVSSRGD
jgi:hypothetical protein